MDVTIDNLKKILAGTSYGKNAQLLKGDDLLREEGVDSLDLLDFYLNIEEEYHIKVDDQDVAGLLTLNDYLRYVKDRLKEIK
jgi:acyl carrier protein